MCGTQVVRDGGIFVPVDHYQYGNSGWSILASQNPWMVVSLVGAQQLSLVVFNSVFQLVAECIRYIFCMWLMRKYFCSLLHWAASNSRCKFDEIMVHLCVCDLIAVPVRRSMF